MITALALAVGLVASPLQGGTGWDVPDGRYVSEAPWAVFFYDQASLDATRHYMDIVDEQIEAHLSVEVKVTSSIKKLATGCPPVTSTGYHVIVVRLDPAEDRSFASRCVSGNMSHGSIVTFSGPNWTSKTRAGSHAVYRRNVSSHEIAHAVGVNHPVECTVTGTDPLMCGSRWGGYSALADAHKFTPYDVLAFQALVANRP